MSILSLTYVPEPNFGTCDDNGNCDGVIGVLQRHEAEVSIVGVPLIAINPRFPMPINVNRFVAQWDTTIASYTDPPISVRGRDVDESLFVFGRVICWLYLVTLMVVYLVYKVRIRLRRRRRLRRFPLCWQIVALILNQDTFVLQKLRPLLTCLIMFSMLFTFLYNCSFTTDLTVEIQQDPVETLEDLLKSDRSPAFDSATELYKIWFEKAPSDSVNGQVWARTSHRHIYDQSGMPMFARQMRRDHEHLALICPSVPLKIMHHASCIFDPQSASRFYISRHNLQSWLHGVASATNARSEVVRRLNFIAQRAMETGFNTYLEDHAGLDIARWTCNLACGENDETNFEHRLNKCVEGIDGSGDDEENLDIVVGLGHMTQLLTRDFPRCLTLAGLLLIMELFIRTSLCRRRRMARYAWKLFRRFVLKLADNLKL